MGQFLIKLPNMPTLAIALLLTSAALHALWNLLLKQSREKYLAMGWQVIIGSLVSFVALFFIGLPPRSLWILIITSTLLEAIYFAILTYAYNDHDFSLVYPVARGAAAALVVIGQRYSWVRYRVPAVSMGSYNRKRINHNRCYKPAPKSFLVNDTSGEYLFHYLSPW